MTRFADRSCAGRALAERVRLMVREEDGVVLALPRGGVPVAAEVARELGWPLDVLIVRKLGVPGQEELAFGAIASGGVMVLNEDIVAAARVGTATIERVRASETAELQRRERLYRGDRPMRPVRGKTVVLVDDGLATGATMRAAASALRSADPRRIIVATPVASVEAARMLADEADACVCVMTPDPFFGVGAWYENFEQTSDDEVRRLLADASTPGQR